MGDELKPLAGAAALPLPLPLTSLPTCALGTSIRGGGYGNVWTLDLKETLMI